MKKIIFTFIFILVATFSFAQRPNMMPTQFGGEFMKNYEVVDSLPLDYIWLHFNKEVENENFIDCGDGYYLAPLPHKDNMIIRYNADKTKAIIVYNSYAFGQRFEFDIQENERRLIFYHQDKKFYCGYIYDKEFKVCKYFESKKDYRNFMRRPIFRHGFRPNGHINMYPDVISAKPEN